MVGLLPWLVGSQYTATFGEGTRSSNVYPAFSFVIYPSVHPYFSVAARTSTFTIDFNLSNCSCTGNPRDRFDRRCFRCCERYDNADEPTEVEVDEEAGKGKGTCSGALRISTTQEEATTAKDEAGSNAVLLLDPHTHHRPSLWCLYWYSHGSYRCTGCYHCLSSNR